METIALEEREAFLPENGVDGDQGAEVKFEKESAASNDAATSIKRLLFTSHFLSTWNSRVFEFGAVLFLAKLFPGTLLPPSVYAIVRAASAISFSPFIGSYIDRTQRLKAVRLSIVVQRLAVVASCLLFWVMSLEMINRTPLKPIMFGVVCLMACAEKMFSIMNLIAVERDWVVVIAENTSCELTILNAQMRRIDLFCKLVGPLLIALVDGFSTRSAIWTTIGMSIVSVAVEYFAIARVFRQIPALQSRNLNQRNKNEDANESLPNQLASKARSCYHSLISYICHQAFLPSMALALLYLTVLSFSGQMITYLLATGITSFQIGILRTISVVLEISATWFTPIAINSVGPIRAGLWSVGWQTLIITTTASLFWISQAPVTAAIWLVAGVALSRVGLWGFDLSVQMLVQEKVEAEARGSFSSTEASFQNFFELCAYATTVVFAKPEQFRYPVLISTVAILIASSLYAGFVRRRRGHLTHLSRCMKGDTIRT